MNRILAALFALAALLSASAAAQAEKETARFAIVIGQNASDSTRVADLRYADDDAVATQRMFVQSGIESVLLVSLDEDSKRLYPDLLIKGSPTREKLLSEYEKLRILMSKAKAVGHRVEFLFVYSGHGNVEHGEGYIVLEMGRLTRADLYEQILANSPADRNHVIVDACKSYYLAFKKGPGGERKSYTDHFVAQEDSDVFASTGFLLSTSSNRDSHEWERFQAGVFSHELRSAMRGGADVDGNNLVTYAELGAFLETANEMIANPRYRPDFVVQPPGDKPLEYSQVIIDWTRHKDVLVLDSTVWGHIYIEDENGERLCDLHPAGSEQFSIFLPAERPMFIRKADESEEMVIEGNGIAMFSELVPRSVLVGRKGALHLSFENLFEEPFGRKKLEIYKSKFAFRPVGEQGTSVTAKLERPGYSVVETTFLWTAIGSAAMGVAANLWAYERKKNGENASQARKSELNQEISKLNTAAIVFYSLAGVAAATWLTFVLLPDDSKSEQTLTILPALGPDSVGLGLEIQFDP